MNSPRLSAELHPAQPASAVELATRPETFLQRSALRMTGLLRRRAGWRSRRLPSGWGARYRLQGLPSRLPPLIPAPETEHFSSESGLKGCDGPVNFRIWHGQRCTRPAGNAQTGAVHGRSVRCALAGWLAKNAVRHDVRHPAATRLRRLLPGLPAPESLADPLVSNQRRRQNRI